MWLGEWRLDSVSGGRFRLDGGTMFGVVPKTIWEKVCPGDERNRISCSTHCVLARSGRTTVLIESGYGALSARQRAIYAADEGEPLLAGLNALGVAPDDVDLVALTHLHFDHAGGCTRIAADGRRVPVFPRARHVVQRLEWLDAAGNAPELRGSYVEENFLPLEEAGLVDLVDGEAELAPGMRALPTPGHTRGHQSFLVSSGGRTACFLGDLCPTTAHLRTRWCMAYDVDPLEVRRRKPRLLGQAADEGWYVLFGHDPDWAGAALARDPRHEFVLREPFARL